MIFRRHIRSLSDEDLLSEYRKRCEPEILGELYQRYGHLVFGVALKYMKNREEASDITISVFEKLSEVLRREEVRTFSPWLHQVAKNHCLMALRSRERYAKRLEDYQRIINAEQREQSSDTDERFRALESALNGLEEQQRLCLTMFYMQEKSYREIACVTGFTEGSVKSHIQNGRRRLRLMLTGIR